jgi:lactoylglutathione lyase
MRYLHTMIRVGDLEKSKHFYEKALGFREVKRQDHEEGKFTLVFMKAGGEKGDNQPMIELTYNWGVASYEKGKGYGHMAYLVDSMEATVSQIEKAGYKLSWGPGITPDGGRAMAFVSDPDGYQIELLEGQD